MDKGAGLICNLANVFSRGPLHELREQSEAETWKSRETDTYSFLGSEATRRDDVKVLEPS